MSRNLSGGVIHRPVYLPDFSMLLGCKCGVRFEPSDNDDDWHEHAVAVGAVVLPVCS